jgi:hypothetical protein
VGSPHPIVQKFIRGSEPYIRKGVAGVELYGLIEVADGLICRFTGKLPRFV